MSSPLPGAGAALSAYRNAAGLASDAPTAGNTAAAAGSFGAMLERAVEKVVDTTRAADVASVQGLRGEVGATEVVLAVSRAELALQTTVAVRDRVVSAYQEVMRMSL
ncbi:flagellar hook-basal body complex protein FliE [Pseudoroseomonas cervicalis]|uniref:flagellar hook-basal body complex protein FliE n=1 Tax=Teichococcus cervicalis TaxID=204525 RepID=UPI0022F152E3|nr:flagellar hook-basal body complex protein FliE [Pseudoroseomonas cervicalis]WBV44584.1 flagellar hook-basal body complex protein FliE [Pseudoroseomonas cervicalis]